MTVPRMYGELAPWFHLLTQPSDYAGEADVYARAIDAATDGTARRLLELGSGGGNTASHLTSRFACTLTDLSPEMLGVSEELNPECEHVVGDMRTLRLRGRFDAVLVHDAVMYLTTEEDLRAAISTAAEHLRPGGVVLLVPDAVRETFAETTHHGGHDGPDGRALRYLEWITDPDPTDTVFTADYAIVLHEPGHPTRVELDRHDLGLFPRATWLALLEAAGLETLGVAVDDPYADEHVLFLARRPAA
jgi:SAM-dependent methyltransferase